MSLFPLNQGAGPSGFGYRSTAEAVTHGLDLSGKTYLVTGCSTGLGRETLRVLTLRGACVIALARTLENARKVCAQVAGDTVPLACELSDPGSINRAIDEVRSGDHRLDGIIANAGIMALPKLQQKFDLELQFLTNHVGHFILVTGLIDQLTDHGRVVMLSSVAHKRTYHDGIQFNNLSGENNLRAMARLWTVEVVQSFVCTAPIDPVTWVTADRKCRTSGCHCDTVDATYEPATAR